MSKDKFPVLYKYTTRGQAQQWQIVVNKDHFYTIEGMVGGKLTTSLPTYCEAKNVGRSNETSPEEQALSEAQSKFDKKKAQGSYNEVLTDQKNFFEPMLAKDYKEAKIDWDNLTHKVYVQPKLDGLRCINAGNTLMSRNGKPYLACPHLHQSIAMLDGELYNHSLKDDFNQIVSLCKKQKPTLEQIKESRLIVEYWIYDFPGHEGTFSERYEALKKYIAKSKNGSFVLVPTYEVKSEQEVKDWHAKFLSLGYEGTIVRLDNSNYECKRSKQLLKFKDFVDEEFTITGYEEGTGGRVGTIGFFILKHDKNPNLTFKSNVKGSFPYLKEVWKNRDKYIGKEATVKYFQRTPLQEDGTGNVPRFPYIIKLDRKDYE